MDVGCECVISDKWIPKNISTGLLDIDGREIKTSDKISLNGCTSSTAIVGKTERGFVLFFGSKNGSCEWRLSNKTINEHSIQVI